MNPMIMRSSFRIFTGRISDTILKKSKKGRSGCPEKTLSEKTASSFCFKDENHLEEIKAVYVPFWMYDLESSGRFQYQGTRVRFWETEKYECTETSFYHIVRKGSMKFCRIPVDGSEKIDDTMMER